jgi:Trm5-related predicted tRNA methylase
MGIAKSIPQTSNIGKFREKVKIGDFVGNPQRINEIVSSLGRR